MTTIRKISNHTGLDDVRVDEILVGLGLEPEQLTIDSARAEIIKHLRSEASGNIKKEELEAETARLCQSRRIKIEAQTKRMREAFKPKQSALQGHLIDDSSSPAFKRALSARSLAVERLRNTIRPPEKEPDTQKTIILI